jgi:hypothetical protein
VANAAAAKGAADEPAPLAALVPGPRHVAAIEASRFKTERVYLTLDGHRSDDDDPYVLVSEDFGKTWRSLRGELPRGWTRALREDRTNEDLLYLGTEFGFWVSFDRGGKWQPLQSNLPTVPVHDIAQHATCGDLVVATHGRSLWALDVTPLRQMTKEARSADVHLYDPTDVVVWRRKHSRGVSSARRFFGDNPENEAAVYYSLAKAANSVTLRVEDAAGEVIQTLTAPPTAGLHRVTWDLRRAPRERDAQQQPTGQRRGGFGRGGGRGGFGRGRAAMVQPGSYRVVLEVDGNRQSQTFEVQSDPNFAGLSAAGETGFEDEQAMAGGR